MVCIKQNFRSPPRSTIIDAQTLLAPLWKQLINVPSPSWSWQRREWNPLMQHHRWHGVTHETELTSVLLVNPAERHRHEMVDLTTSVAARHDQEEVSGTAAPGASAFLTRSRLHALGVSGLLSRLPST